MATMGDIYQVSIRLRDGDMKQLENAYFYRARQQWDIGITNLSQAIAEYVNTNLITPRLAWTPTWYTYTGVYVRNLFDESESYELPLSRTGTRTVASDPGHQMPSFTAVKATMSTSNGLVRKGRKMIAGLLETDQATGLLTLVGMTTFSLYAATMVLDIVNAFIPAQYALEPVVVKRIREGTQGNYTYRLPTSQIEAVYGSVQSAVISAVVTTQNSRKD